MKITVHVQKRDTTNCNNYSLHLLILFCFARTNHCLAFSHPHSKTHKYLSTTVQTNKSHVIML